MVPAVFFLNVVGTVKEKINSLIRIFSSWRKQSSKTVYEKKGELPQMSVTAIIGHALYKCCTLSF